MLIGLLLALGAMLVNSVAGLLQSDATRHVRRRHPLVSQPAYLGGLIMDGLGWIATVAALRHLPVFVVQSVLAGAIAVTAVGSRIVYGSRLRRVDRVALAACLVGLGLVAGSADENPPEAVSRVALLALAGAAGLLVIALVALWQSGRTWPLAVVAGLGFGSTSLAVRAIHHGGDGDTLLAVLRQPALYLVVAFWVIGLIAYSRALELTSLPHVTAVLLVTEAVIPGLLGMALLGEHPREGWWWPLGIGLLIAVAGVAVLAGSPAQQPPPPSVRAGERRTGAGHSRMALGSSGPAGHGRTPVGTVPARAEHGSQPDWSDRRI